MHQVSEPFVHRQQQEDMISEHFPSVPLHFPCASTSDLASVPMCRFPSVPNNTNVSYTETSISHCAYTV